MVHSGGLLSHEAIRSVTTPPVKWDASPLNGGFKMLQ